ncbi:uncharacterized protein LOC119871768 isoform X9 [Canis lupus familiaris]|uniref:uncharacterized protein LOC119871768 isoform X9 n=1 Tax=Canis lupus familiaris TaxID=9615 RepID=UPI0018F6557B|nr:uncharacterized protein LOC119871768 isoform X9 [Canis lupus familiaris]
MTDTPIPPCARWVPLAREQACSSHTGMWSPSCSPRPPSGYSHITALRVGSLVALLLASGFNFDEVQSVAFCPWSCACGIQEKPSIPAPAPSPQGHSLAGPPTTISAPAWGWETSPPSISTMQEDPETLLALQRANIVAQHHQVGPRRDHRHYTPTTGGTIPARAGEAQEGIRAKDEPGQPRQGP